MSFYVRGDLTVRFGAIYFLWGSTFCSSPNALLYFLHTIIFYCDFYPRFASLLYCRVFNCRVFIQIGKTCQDCLRDGDSVRIAPGDHLVASCVKPWHIGCALKRRRSMVEEITTEADERAARNSAEKARNDETSRNASTNKRPRESLVRGEQLDLS